MLHAQMLNINDHGHNPPERSVQSVDHSASFYIKVLGPKLVSIYEDKHGRENTTLRLCCHTNIHVQMSQRTMLIFIMKICHRCLRVVPLFSNLHSVHCFNCVSILIAEKASFLSEAFISKGTRDIKGVEKVCAPYGNVYFPFSSVY